MGYVQVIESFAYGSAKSVKQLCNIVKSSGDVTVYYGRRDGTELELNDLPAHVNWIELPGSGIFKHLQNILFLKKSIAPEAKVIHGHSTFGGLYIRVLNALNVFNTSSSRYYYSPRGYAFLREDLPKLFRKVFYVYEFLCAKLSVTVACGPSEKNMADSFGGRAVKINNSLAVPKGGVLYNHSGGILAVGRICYQKGFDIFVDVARAMPDVSFTWIGSYEEKDSALLDALPLNIIIKDYMPHELLLAEIENSCLVLLPSRWEGLSRVLLETLVVGRPIVTSKIAANVDCLDGVSGSFKNGFSCLDVNEYVLSINKVLSNCETATSMAVASREYARREFEYEKVTQQWLELYK
ncbi:MAG: glycosyltransferase [Colwellia sp.]|jgi:Glycosyltransferase